MATVNRAVSEYSNVLLRNVSWDQYEAFLEWLGDRPGVKVNYDCGDMEIMAPLIRHDRVKTIIGRFFEMLCFELDRDLFSGGAVTLKNQLAEKGIEADECYWLQNEEVMRCKMELDLEVDPPPDLAIEVENTNSILARLPIYAGIGVPEIWRWENESMKVLLLGDDGRYRDSPISAAFPELPMGSFSRLVNLCYEIDERTLIKRFVAWVREGMPPLN